MVITDKIKKVAFPREHGSWGFFLEPIILSLVIAFSQYGIIISISAFFLFLANQPSSYILKQTPKYLIPISITFLIIYVSLALILMFSIYVNAEESIFVIPFLFAIILMLVYKYLEKLGLNRILLVEIIPQIAVLLIAISILLVSKWSVQLIIGFSIIILSRSIQTVIYINNKLKFFKGYAPNIRLTNLVGIIFMFLLILSSFLGYTPMLSIIGIGGLILRSIIGFSEKNRTEKVKIVGIKEFIYGFLFIVIIAIGYNQNI